MLLRQAAIYHSQEFSTAPSVDYHIIYSSSYRVPVLYFLIHDLPPAESRSIETVYRLLVPRHLEDGTRHVGVMGGIGMTVSTRP